MTIKNVMQAEFAALMAETASRDAGGVLPYAAVTNPDVLVSTPFWLRRRYPIRIESLPGKDRHDMSFVQVCPRLNYKFLWVHAGNHGYRDDYRTFLREIHKVTENLPSSVHVDHLYNRQRARQFETPWIRLVLTPQPVNSSHGAGYEKGRTRSGIGRPGRDHPMDLVTLLKAYGMPSPRKGLPLSPDMLIYIQKIAPLISMSVTEIVEVIGNLMEVASRRQ